MKKNTPKPATLTCWRADGTYTWAKLHQGFEDHDLAHVAVESILEFENAFFGLIIKGFDIQAYELPKEVKPEELQSYNLPEEALQTEHLVNLLQTEYWNNELIPNLLEMLENILKKNNIPFPKKLTQEKLEEIKKAYRENIKLWKEVEINSKLVFYFGK